MSSSIDARIAIHVLHSKLAARILNVGAVRVVVAFVVPVAREGIRAVRRLRNTAVARFANLTKADIGAATIGVGRARAATMRCVIPPISNRDALVR